MFPGKYFAMRVITRKCLRHVRIYVNCFPPNESFRVLNNTLAIKKKQNFSLHIYVYVWLTGLQNSTLIILSIPHTNRTKCHRQNVEWEKMYLKVDNTIIRWTKITDQYEIILVSRMNETWFSPTHTQQKKKKKHSVMKSPRLTTHNVWHNESRIVVSQESLIFYTVYSLRMPSVVELTTRSHICVHGKEIWSISYIIWFLCFYSSRISHFVTWREIWNVCCWSAETIWDTNVYQL